MFSYRDVGHVDRFGVSQLDCAGNSAFIRRRGSSETFVKIDEGFQLWILARAVTAQEMNEVFLERWSPVVVAQVGSDGHGKNGFAVIHPLNKQIQYARGGLVCRA